jgi:O-antigen/teichoic acid export membrane protein
MSAEPQFALRVAEATPEKLLAGVLETGVGLFLTPARLRVWGIRSGLALVDQGLTSGAGFGVNLLLARWMPAELYGAFAVAFAGFLFISGFHNVLLLEPMSVLGPSRHAERLPAYFRAQIVIHAVLVGALSAAGLLTGLVLWRVYPDSSLTGAIVGAGLTLPFLLLLWLARRMCYVVQRPSIAVTGSAFYFVFVLAGLFVLGRLGRLVPFTAFLLMGCGSLAAAVALLWRVGVLKRGKEPEPGISWRERLRENWTYGRWLVGSAVLFSVSSQVQTFLAAAMLGLSAAGILRAMQLPSLVMTQVVTATSLLFLPVFSRDFGREAIGRMHQKAKFVSMGLAVPNLCFVVGLTLFAGRAEYLLFNGKYASYAWLIPVLALIPVVNGLSAGYSMALRAAQKPHFDFVSNVFAAPAAVVSAVIFMRWWGLAGAAASLVLSFAVLSAVTLVLFRQSVRQPAPCGESVSVRS